MAKYSNRGADGPMKPVYQKIGNIIQYEIDSDATGGVDIEVDFDADIFDVIAISKATVTDATVTLSDGTNDITDDMDIDTLDNVARAGTIDTTYSSVKRGSTLTLTTANAGDRCVVRILANRA